jgi:glyoxylase-like metal-dependent hydrolase (beta-lactamase superfamily II)
MTTHRIERVQGSVMPVNSFLIHGPSGVVVIDGMLTVSDAKLVRDAIAASGKPLAGVVITHPHPDHYAAAGEIIEHRDGIPIVATEAVDKVVRRDDDLKNSIVGPMMGAEWPSRRVFPNHTVATDAVVSLGGIELRVEEVGAGESDVDTIWRLDDTTLFAGDVVYNRMHAYLADNRWQEWLTLLDRLDGDLPANASLHIGHGAEGGKALLSAQRHYIETFIEAVSTNADAVAAGDHTPVLKAVKAVLPTEDLLFLTDLSAEPVAAHLHR